MKEYFAELVSSYGSLRVRGCAVIQDRCVKQCFCCSSERWDSSTARLSAITPSSTPVEQFGDKISQTDIAEHLVTALIL